MGDINVGVGILIGLGAVTKTGGFKTGGGTDWVVTGTSHCFRDGGSGGGGGGGGGGAGVNLPVLAGDLSFGLETFEILVDDSRVFSKGL